MSSAWILPLVKILRGLKGLILFRLKKGEESEKLIQRAKKEGNLSIQEEIDYYSNTDDLKKAVIKLDTLIKDNPEDIKLLKEKAMILAEDEEYEKSNDVYDILLEKEENKKFYLRYKFHNYFNMRDYDNALNLLDQVYRLTPKDKIRKFEDLFTIYSKKKNHKEALYFLNKIIELNLDSDDLLRFLLSKSRILIKLKKYDEALEFHEILIKDYSNDPEDVLSIDFNKALIYAHLDRREKAINIMENSLQLKSEGKDYRLYEYGKILMVLNEYEEAIKKFQEAQKIKPKTLTTCYKIAKCYEKLNDYKSALENLNNMKKIAQNKIKEGKGMKLYNSRYIEKADKKIEELKDQDSKS